MLAIKKDGWVGLRMMFLLGAYDPSMWCSPEMRRAKAYYTEKYKMLSKDWVNVAVLLAQDNAMRGTFLERGV